MGADLWRRINGGSGDYCDGHSIKAQNARKQGGTTQSRLVQRQQSPLAPNGGLAQPVTCQPCRCQYHSELQVPFDTTRRHGPFLSFARTVGFISRVQGRQHCAEHRCSPDCCSGIRGERAEMLSRHVAAWRWIRRGRLALSSHLSVLPGKPSQFPGTREYGELTCTSSLCSCRSLSEMGA